MAQKTQFLMTKYSDSIRVQPTDLAAYLADGWTINNVTYSEGGEGLDITSQVLMQSSSDVISVRPNSVPDYLASGYKVVGIIYGSGQTPIDGKHGAISFIFLDTPDFDNAEVGAVATTKMVVTFTTEIVSSDYKAGVTIKVNDVSKTISAAARQTNHKVVHYTIPAVANGDVITWGYDDASGLIRSEVDGSHMDDVVDAEVTNNVPA